MIRLNAVDKHKVKDFSVLVLRWYLAYYMVDYGWGKLMAEQFGLHDPHIAEKPLKDVNIFYVTWYLFGQSKMFKILGGLIEITGALLIIINPTVIIGTLFLLPVLVQIFIIDVSFTVDMFGSALPVRLAGMIFCDLLILWYYRKQLILAWQQLTRSVSTKFRYKWWVFIILPVLGMLTDIGMGVILYPVRRLLDWLIL